ncbi:hypothetical protein C0J52_09524 [Blattella germanica]|nr:hypothetical protein C0J52_09524 [Blattella germanica]
MRLRSFTCSEKLKIIKDAEEHGNRASACKFDKEVCISFLKCNKFIHLEQIFTFFIFPPPKLRVRGLSAGYSRKYGMSYTNYLAKYSRELLIFTSFLLLSTSFSLLSWKINSVSIKFKS